MRFAGGLSALLFCVSGCAAGMGRPPSPCAVLAESGYRRVSAPHEIAACLADLARRPAAGITAEVRELGRSVEGRPIEALVLSGSGPGRLKLMLVAAQHGMEPSGAEALIAAAGALANGRLRPLLDELEVMIVPLANPDGYARRRRVNAAGINTSTDFGRLAAPETRALNQALLRFRPEVVLDLHESALLKKKSLGREGYLTDFEAQFEYANNPNVDAGLRILSAELILPELIARTQDRGLPAGRYLGEITSLRQVLAHGGLSAGNLRNKAGLLGAVSFLVENRLDPSNGSYLTWRNIKERVSKQLLATEALLEVCRRRRPEIQAAVSQARAASRCGAKLWLDPEYAPAAEGAVRSVNLRSIKSGRLEAHRFVYHGAVARGAGRSMPQTVEFHSHPSFFRSWLAAQGIQGRATKGRGNGSGLAVDLCQPLGLLVPLYLDGASSSSILPGLGFAPELRFVAQQP